MRFLPLSLLSFLVAPIAGRLSARVPIRALIGGGMLLVAIALMLMRGLSASSEWTALLGGFIVAGVGVGARQRAAGLDRGQRGPAGAGGHGLGDQLHLPPGRASPPARRRSARSSSTSWPATRTARWRACPPRCSPRAARRCPGRRRTRPTLTLFTDGMNDILLVAAIVAFAGAVLSFALIRGQRLRRLAGRGAPPPEAEPELTAAA